MNYLITLTALLLTLDCSAQNYEPFNSVSSKRFFDVDTISNDGYYFHLDDALSSGDTTIFYQYRKLTQTSDFTDYCGFWGGPSGLFLDTTWLGTQIRWNEVSKELFFQNSLSETIHFNFNLPLGTAAPFYTNATTEYRIEHTMNELGSFYGITDSVQVYEIQAFDLVGTAVTSELNGFEIKLSKNYGLLSFINCYEFPLVAQKLALQGQTNPDFGKFSLTMDELYPWQTGDQLQYRNAQLGQGAYQYNYQMLTVTDRIETADSVWIYLTSSLIEPSPNPFAGPFNYSRSSQPIIYRKGSFISYVPRNRTNYEVAPYAPVIFRGESTISNFCTSSLEALFISGDFQFLCDTCQCYGGYDGHGSSTSSTTYLENFGKSSSRYEPYGYYFNGTGLGSTLIYADVNGVTCGNLWADLDKLNTFNLTLSPNPSNDIVTVKSELPITSIHVRDFFGRIILELSEINQKETTISLADLQDGAYIVEVKANNSIQKKTIFKH